MNYTNEFLSRCFAAYMGAKVKRVLWLPYWDVAAIGVDKIQLVMSERIANEDTWVCSEELKLILKPLSAISYEDAIEVAKILKDQSDPELFDSEIFNEWMEDVITGNCATYADYVSGRQFQQVMDFLRSKSYDCGFMQIKSLIEAGIAIVEPLKTDI